MLRVALTLSAVVAYAPQRATKQTVRSAPLQQPRGLTTVSASSLEPEADGGFDLVQGRLISLSRRCAWAPAR